MSTPDRAPGPQAGDDPIGAAREEVARANVVPAAAPDTAGRGERPGDVIGRYKLLQEIGEGGFGVVWMAEQSEPVRRKVALKVIKLGMDTRQVVARFEAERQALALMDHPHIAKVLDGGATASGRPYFVMELVKGVPIVEYCDKNGLTIAERLELMAQVCHAVQHAHNKGIIHRDLKSSNVLVATQDGRPQVKVIDFGIAKATSQTLTERTLFTEHQQVIGTLQYMSPEQAQGSLDIDTRTDVYSLGILLYELLTGSTPFDARTLRDAMYGEIQRIIREVDPPRPSTRLSESADALAGIAAHRRIEPRRLGLLLRGELDWIVMKALEKDRARRYETANGLAMDLHRYLSGEAIVAAPPSKAYQLRKLVRRHRVLVTGAAAVALALLLGLVAFAWQARVARQQRDLALDAQRAEAEQHRQADEQRRIADEQRDRADRAREEEARQRALAQEQGERARQQAQLALSSVQYVLTDIDNALRQQPGTSDLRIAILEKVAGKWTELDLEMTGGVRGEALPTLMAVRYQLASAFTELDRLGEADREFEKLHALAVERLEVKGRTDSARTNLARIEFSWAPVRGRIGADPGAAEALLQSSVELVRECLHDPHPQPGSPSQEEIRTLLAVLLQNLGVRHLNQGRLPEAVTLFQEGLEILAGVLEDIRSEPGFSELSDDEKDTKTASLQLSHDKAALAVAYVQLRLGRTEESLALYDRAIRARREILDRRPGMLVMKEELAGCLGLYGNSLLWLDRPDEAEPLIDESNQLLEEVVAEDPAKADSRRQLATALYRMGTLKDLQESPDQAQALFERSRELRGELYVASPDEKNAVNLMLAEARVGDAARASELIDLLGAMDGVDGERHLERARALAQLSRRAERDQQARLREEALTALERAIAEGYSDPFRVEHENDLDPLHGEERFQAVMARLGAGQER